MKAWMWAVTAGVVLGFAYTISPLTIMFLGALVPLWRWASSGLSDIERRWLLTVFCLAVALRLAVIGGLFLTADPNIPYANFFGDEEFFKRRTTWMRNISMGIPVSPADYLYAFDKTGDSGYLYFLTYIQALFGLAPYGVHVLNAGLYLGAAVILYKLVRPSFGGAAAFGGAALLLFLPSLFIWSISALKEPLYFLVAAINLSFAVLVVRAECWWLRLLSAAAVLAGGFLLQSLREGGLALAAAGVVGGLLLAYVVRRPRVLLACAVSLPFVAALAVTRPGVQERIWTGVHQAAYKHWGHVNTPGLTYKILDERFYPERDSVATMSAGEAGRFVIRAIDSYLFVPLPWQIESRAALAFLPEQMVWYVLVLLIPIGVVIGFRRDALLTSLLLAHGAAVAMIVAVSGGNVGTLVRHRGLALPYFVWLSALGAVTIAQSLVSPAARHQGFAMPPESNKVGLQWF